MVEYNSKKNHPMLNISGEYLNTLDIEGFSLMMKDPSYCYKFYWLEAIVNLISTGILDTTFEEIIDEMIANAWYAVRELHIHLSRTQHGEVRDGLERAVMKLADVSTLPPTASKSEIKQAICIHFSELKPYKEQLTNMVPYRALAGFFQRMNAPANWSSSTRMVEYIKRVNQVVLLPYTLGTSKKLKKEVHFNSLWSKMIQDNMVSILRWIQDEKVQWLQMNNPDMPDLEHKLAPSNIKIRKLDKIRNL